MRRTLPLLILSLAACGAQSSLQAPPNLSAPGTDASSTEASAPDTGGSESVDAQPSLTFWAPQGTLFVEAGEVNPLDSTLSAVVLSDELLPQCTVMLPILQVSPSPEPMPDPPLVGWWQVEYDEGLTDADDCVSWTAGTLQLGFGLVDPALDPALAARGWEKATPYGLYLQPDGDEVVYAVGVAGTEAMFLGVEVAGAAGPVPDGQYRVVGLVALDL